MAVKLKLKVSEASEDHFITAVFRFIELNISSLDQDIMLTTTSGGEPDWIRAELEFSTSDLASRFQRFLGLRLPEGVLVGA